MQILDQHLRRFRGHDAAGGSTLAELVRLYTGATIPDDCKVLERVAAAWPGAHEGPDTELSDLVGRIAELTLLAYRKLAAEAEEIQAAVADSNALGHLAHLAHRVQLAHPVQAAS